MDDGLFHPGDALDAPEQDVDVAFVPLHANWLKTAEVLDLAQRLRAARLVGIHDGQLNERGRAEVAGWLRRRLGGRYLDVAPDGVVPAQ